MAVRMVALNRLKNGQFLSRKVIPVDVQDAYARLYGQRREALLRQPADTARHDAKARHAEWTAEIETRIETLRAQSKGVGEPLTRLNAIALAGRWYTWYVKQHEDDPGTPKRWREMGDHLVWQVLHPEARTSTTKTRRPIRTGNGLRSPKFEKRLGHKSQSWPGWQPSSPAKVAR